MDILLSHPLLHFWTNLINFSVIFSPQYDLVQWDWHNSPWYQREI